MLEKFKNTGSDQQRSHGAAGDHADVHVDEWHHHDAAEGHAQSEHAGQVNTTIIAKWFVVIVAFVVGSIAFIVVYFNQYNAGIRARSVETTLAGDYVKYRDASQGKLSTAGHPDAWTGLAGDKVQVPVANAMQKVMESYKGGSVSLAGSAPAAQAPVK